MEEPFDNNARSQFGSGFRTTKSIIIADANGYYLTSDGRHMNANGTEIPLDTEVYLVTCITPKGLYVVDWAIVSDPRINE